MPNINELGSGAVLVESRKIIFDEDQGGASAKKCDSIALVPLWMDARSIVREALRYRCSFA
jgi:hypothetical protein